MTLIMTDNLIQHITDEYIQHIVDGLQPHVVFKTVILKLDNKARLETVQKLRQVIQTSQEQIPECIKLFFIREWLTKLYDAYLNNYSESEYLDRAKIFDSEVVARERNETHTKQENVWNELENSTVKFSNEFKMLIELIKSENFLP